MPTTEPVEMELHIAGGYLDEEGTSQNLSTSIVHSFSKLADKYQGQIKISLSTAAISSMTTTTTTTTTVEADFLERISLSKPIERRNRTDESTSVPRRRGRSPSTI